MSGRNADRYTTLSGDKIHTPLRRAFFQAADFKAGLAASVACYAVNALILKSPDAVSLGIACALSNTVGSGIVRVIENTVLFPGVRTDHKNKSIDTAPDQNTPPNTPDSRLNATRAYHAYHLYLGIAVAMDLLSGSSLQSVFSNVAPYTRKLQGMMRFNRVANDHWTIVDTPPPQKVIQTEKEKGPLMLLPQAGLSP